MKQSILETEIERWAAEHGYPMTPRKFYEEIQAENDIIDEIGGPSGKDLAMWAAIFGAEKGKTILPGSAEEEQIRRNLAEMDKRDYDLVRDVWTPSGLLEYAVDFKNSIRGMPNEKSYEGYLEEVKGLAEERISLFHQSRILPNWKNDKMPRGERKHPGGANYFLTLLLNPKEPYLGVDLFGSDRTIENFLQLSDINASIDPIERAIFEEAQRTYQGRKIPRTPEGYRSILDIFARLIETAH